MIVESGVWTVGEDSAGNGLKIIANKVAGNNKWQSVPLNHIDPTAGASPLVWPNTDGSMEPPAVFTQITTQETQERAFITR
jgi:hypothetical protein